MSSKLAIVFDGPPANESGRFIEVELDGAGVSFGEWQQNGEYWELVLPEPYPRLAALEAELKAEIESRTRWAKAWKDASKRVERLDSLRAFDIEGAESWARATMEQWNHSDAETRKIMHGGVKVAEKLLAILPKLKEALAEERT